MQWLPVGENCGLSGINEDGFYSGGCEEVGKVVLCSYVASHGMLLYPTTPSSAAE